MKIAVIGSRTFADYAFLSSILAYMRPAEIVSGGAAGADSLAEKYAAEHGIPFRAFLPKFKTDPAVPYHPKWFHARNKEIVDHADFVLALWDGKSSGTRQVVEYARETGKPIRIEWTLAPAALKARTSGARFRTAHGGGKRAIGEQATRYGAA